MFQANGATELTGCFFLPAGDFDLIYRTVGKLVFVLSAVCISDSRTVTPDFECIQKGKGNSIYVYNCYRASPELLHFICFEL
jgi:hypothetical protein